MSEKTPILPYGRQWLLDEDVEAVAACLRSDWLTQGPGVDRFERALCEVTGARHAVAVNSGTAALHLATLACGVVPGDVGVVPAVTFVASANAVAYAGGQVRFADVDAETGLADAASFRRQVDALCERGTPPKVLIPVDFAGQTADLPAIRELASRIGAKVIEDAAHALGASYTWQGASCRAGGGVHSDAAILSFHPVKHITTGEGGALLTNDDALALRARELRSHGIHRDPERLQRKGEGPWYHEQSVLGFNYRITDVQCALGLSQLSRLEEFLRLRRGIAAAYDRALAAEPLSRHLAPLRRLPDRSHAYHLYVVRVLDPQGRGEAWVAARRRRLYDFLRDRAIASQVHYIPVNWQPYYRTRHGSGFDDCPSANRYYASCLSIPMFPRMQEPDVLRVVSALEDWARDPG
jgi:UDP-4-amino-4,6-dideoxy-N-acetyl-beta-L-altrosamine transaminase